MVYFLRSFSYGENKYSNISRRELGAAVVQYIVAIYKWVNLKV